MGVATYNADIETGRPLEIDTLYFDESGNTFIRKSWEETNLFLMFERMKNSYMEIVKYLEFNHEPRDEDAPIVIGADEENKDYSYIIQEMKERVDDCAYYQNNLAENATKDGFPQFIMGELTKHESHSNTAVNFVLTPR